MRRYPQKTCVAAGTVVAPLLLSHPSRFVGHLTSPSAIVLNRFDRNSNNRDTGRPPSSQSLPPPPRPSRGGNNNTSKQGGSFRNGSRFGSSGQQSQNARTFRRGSEKGSDASTNGGGFDSAGLMNSRQLMHLVDSARRDFLREPCDAVRSRYLNLLMGDAVSLFHVPDFDQRLAVRLLTVLATLQAPADAPLIGDVMGLLSVHVESLSLLNLAQVLSALQSLGYSELPTFVASLPHIQNERRLSSALAPEATVNVPCQLAVAVWDAIMQDRAWSRNQPQLSKALELLASNIADNPDALTHEQRFLILQRVAATVSKYDEVALDPPMLKLAQCATSVLTTSQVVQNLQLTELIEVLQAALTLKEKAALIGISTELCTSFAAACQVHLAKSLSDATAALAAHSASREGGAKSTVSESVKSNDYVTVRAFGLLDALLGQKESLGSGAASNSDLSKAITNFVTAALSETNDRYSVETVAAVWQLLQHSKQLPNQPSTEPSLLQELCESALRGHAAALDKQPPSLWSPWTVRSVVLLLTTATTAPSSQVNPEKRSSSTSSHVTVATSTESAVAFLKQYLLTTRFTSETPTTRAACITPLLVDGVTRHFEREIDFFTERCAESWSVSEVLFFLSVASGVENLFIRGVLRKLAQTLSRNVERASPSQVVSLMRYYGASGVRDDHFCQCVTNRVHVVASELSGAQWTTILSALAAVEFRGSTVAFADGAGHIMRILAARPPDGKPQGGTTPASTALSVDECTKLLAAFSTMLIMNYNLYVTLAECIRAQVTPAVVRTLASHNPDGLEQLTSQLVTAQLALVYMNVEYHGLVDILVECAAAFDTVTTASPSIIVVEKRILLLSVLSRSAEFMRSFCHKPERLEACKQLMHLFAGSATDQLDEPHVAELMLTLSRLRKALTRNESKQQELAVDMDALFDRLMLRATAFLPSCPPLALSHVVSAAAAYGRRPASVEVFSLAADRVLALQDEIAAVTLASVLLAFSDAGEVNDRLFVELIPRMRLVSHYGKPRDIANCVCAYAKANVWHYKLFARLADRAVVVKHDFDQVQLCRMISAYEKVGMYYDKLLTEFAPRIIALAPALTPQQLAVIGRSHRALRALPSPEVVDALAARAAEIADQFSEDEAKDFIDICFYGDRTANDAVRKLSARFPSCSNAASDTTPRS